MGKYAHLNLGGVRWRCVPCAISLPTEQEFNTHCKEVDVAAHRFCSSCNLVFPTLSGFENHWSETHDCLAPLVSPEAARLEREIAREQAEAVLSDEDRERVEEKRRQEKSERKRLKVEKKRLEAEALRRELESKGPVECVICSSKFVTPGAYAQHLESGTHKNIKRHNVTHAVHMLDVVPPITLAPTILYQESTITSTITPCTSAPTTPGGFSDIGEANSGSVVLASSISNGVFDTPDQCVSSHSSSLFDPAVTYTANDFIHLGIPYACPLCFTTFRTVVQLTAHMNSPVHDPDALKCPNPKCGRQFALVSGLIQHLESGTCKLASGAEIFERFALLTAKFSKYLAV